MYSSHNDMHAMEWIIALQIRIHLIMICMIVLKKTCYFRAFYNSFMKQLCYTDMCNQTNQGRCQ